MSIAAPPDVDERLLTSAARTRALAVGVVAGVIALVMAVWYAGDRNLPGFDRRVMIRIYEWYPDRVALAHRVADLGGSVAVIVMVIAIVAWCLVRRQPRGIALAILGPTVAIVITEYVLKPTVDRRLLGYVTYPSGHSTGVFSIATVLAVVLLGPGRQWRQATRVAIVVAMYAVCVAVSVSLVAAAYHVPTDTIGGAGVAIATVLLLAVAIDTFAERRLRRR